LPNGSQAVRLVASFDADVACFGHGDPVTEDAAASLGAVEV
jgi:hypothetical protein